MKLLNYVFSVFFVTSITFLYTQQRIDAVKLSYEIKEKEDRLNKLLDQKRELEYTIAKLKAPTHLEIQLAKEDVKLVLPERWQVFEITGLNKESVHPSPLFVRRLVDLFSLRAEAQATPVTKQTYRKSR